MSLNDIKTEVLQALFEGYMNHGGTPIFEVGEIITKHGEDPAEVGRYLLDHGWIKNQRFGPRGFSASISIDGIREINPEFINDNLNKIISILGINGGGRSSLMEILEFEPINYQIARDLAHAAESTGFVDIQFTHNDIIVNLNLEGRDFYEKNKAQFS